jgi:hypothetical protein
MQSNPNEVRDVQPQYSIMFKLESDSLSLKSITFKSTTLFNIFKRYTEQTIIDWSRVQSNDEKSIADANIKFNPESKTAEFTSSLGSEHILGKFFLETSLDWPEEYIKRNEFYNPKYKQVFNGDSDEEFRKGSTNLYLSRWGMAKIPIEIIELMNKYIPGTILEIEKTAMLIQQDKRNLGLFAKALYDIAPKNLACHLDPNLSATEAEQQMIEELRNARVFSEQHRPFSYKVDEIIFTTRMGVHVSIVPTIFFSEWFSGLPVKARFKFGDYQGYKGDENSVSLNTGPGKPGIQIRKQGDAFIACNNQSTDQKLHSSNIDYAAGKDHLCKFLAKVYQIFPLDYKIVLLNNSEEKSNNSQTKCPIQ